MKNDFFSRHSKSPSCSLHVNRACILSSESPFSTFFSFLGSSLREMMGGVNGHRLAPLLPPQMPNIWLKSFLGKYLPSTIIRSRGARVIFQNWFDYLGSMKIQSLKPRRKQKVPFDENTPWRGGLEEPPPSLFVLFLFFSSSCHVIERLASAIVSPLVVGMVYGLFSTPSVAGKTSWWPPPPPPLPPPAPLTPFLPCIQLISLCIADK